MKILIPNRVFAACILAVTAMTLVGCSHYETRPARPDSVVAPATATPAATTATVAAKPAAAPAASAATRYDPRQTFAPLELPNPVNVYRGSDGAPGPGYWQNRADYVIHASLDPTNNRLTGDEIITYTNNSPQTLHNLWIQLDENIFRADARARYAHPNRNKGTTEGFVLDRVEIGRQGHLTQADYLVSDTRMQIQLDHALAPHGGKLQIRIHYHHTVPDASLGGRTGHVSTKNGEIYDLAQWYPRMAVYDDLRGWDTLPFMGNEFYLEYGSFDYFVTVPWDMLVAGSGELQNPQDVLTALQRQRLQQARHSDSTLMIRSADEIGDPHSRPKQQGTLTWHFRMSPTRDVSFAASRAFIWDAARINLPGGKTSLAMSFYPVESAGNKDWGRTTEYLKNSVENFSRRWAPYPYPAAVAVGGPVDGMEYPGIIFDGYQSTGSSKSLFWLTAHEIGHTWFPMMVGSNERRDQWMDEGFNTFIDIFESEDFQHGIFGPKRDGEYAPGGGNPVDEIVPLLADPAAPVMLTTADQIQERYRHPVTYFKSALGLVLLREQILGPERFDRAFRQYIRDWTWKHPTPTDFFRTMESVGGEDLSWFWRGWYMNNWSLDLAATDAKPVKGGWSHGAVVTIANLDRLVMPATVKIDFKDGSSRRIHLPVETWIQQDSAHLTLDSTQPVIRVTVDPDHAIPDRDRSNNMWTAGG